MGVICSVVCAITQNLTWISEFVVHLVVSDDGSDELVKATDSCGGVLLFVIVLVSLSEVGILLEEGPV